MFFFKYRSFLLFLVLTASAQDSVTYNGFNSTADLLLDGTTSIRSHGLLDLTNNMVHAKGHAFHPAPLHFKSAAAGKVLPFSTTFVLFIQSKIPNISGNGLAFLISPTTDLSSGLPSQYFGIFNTTNNGNSANHIFAVELDTVQNPEFQDIDDNHVGIDINGLVSNKSHTAGYYVDNLFRNLTLISGQPIQVWIDFDGEENMHLNVSLSPMGMSRPSRPLLSSAIDLSSLMLDAMYVGLSASTGALLETSHCLLGWSFRLNGVADALDYSKLPSLADQSNTDSKSSTSNLRLVWLLIALSVFVSSIVAAILVTLWRRLKYAEVLEDWELEYGPHRFSYKELFQATKGFREKESIGIGGFGRVYRGVLPTSKMEVAIKKVSHESRQGMKEFVAEIVSIGRLRHRNLVQLLGYCRRKGELILVYDYMPNGSLDKLLYDTTQPTLNWAQRFQIIRGVAAGLLYLHEEWEKVVVHRDVRASNVLLDSEFNGRLGDFGLARLCDRGSEPQTTRVVGTMGYIAPELTRAGKATTATDVFAFGAFLLEVGCGRRPIKPHGQDEEDLVLVDWVLAHWQKGLVLQTRDPRLEEEYSSHEMELVLKLGLLCSHPTPAARPSMRQVMQILDGDLALPELSPR